MAKEKDKVVAYDRVQETLVVPGPKAHDQSIHLFAESFVDGTVRVWFEGFGSARVLKLHLADELDLIVQPSKVKEPGKVY